MLKNPKKQKCLLHTLSLEFIILPNIQIVTQKLVSCYLSFPCFFPYESLKTRWNDITVINFLKIPLVRILIPQLTIPQRSDCHTYSNTFCIQNHHCL